MKQVALFLFVTSTILSCQKGKISKADLEGNTYSAKVRLESSATENDMAAGILAMSQMEYRFGDNDQGVYHATIGSMASEMLLKWSLENDSLIIEMIDESRTDRYAISRSDDGYLINDGRNQLELVRK